MKTEKHFLSTILKFAGFFVFLIILATCDVGLGSSVDTNAPTVNITSPTPSQVLRGRFTLGGIATDDVAVSNVIVDIEGIGTTTSKYSFPATVENGKWSLTVDSTGSSPIDDGTYQIKVSVKDTSEKTSYQLTTFTVDNTAPVILVTSPDEKESSMAYNLQFEGKIYDATQINSITLNVYDTEGNVKVTKQASLVGTSEWKVLLEGENELQIGQTSPKLTNGNYNYSVISSDKVGNTSVYFFHKEDIYKKYSGDSISIDEWAAFDKGDKETISGISEDERDEWLDELRIQVDPSLNLSSQTSFSYSDKPVASITWSSIETETNAMTQLNDGDPISGLITPPVGVDAPFKNDTFVAYIWRTKDDDGNVVPIYSDSDRVPDANLSIENVQTSRSFTIKTKGLNLSKGIYSVYIQISNSNNKTFSDKQDFGIALGAPSLVITDLKDLPTAVRQDDALVFEGTALESDRKTPCELRYTLTITDPDGEVIYQTPDQTPSDTNEYNGGIEILTDNTGHWTHSVNDDAANVNIGNNRDGSYAYEFTVLSGDYQVTRSHTVSFDNTPPDITTGLDEVDSFKTLENNRVSIDCSDDLSGIKTISWYLANSEEAGYGDEHIVSTGTVTNISFENDGAGKKIKFVATDKAGNRAQKEYTGITVDNTLPSFKEGFASSAPSYLKIGGSSFNIIVATDNDTVVAEDNIAIDSFEVKATKDGVPQTPSGEASSDASWYSKTRISDNEIVKQLKVKDLNISPFAFDGTYGEGHWVVNVTVYDKSGLSASKTYSFTVDTKPPVVDAIDSIDAPKDMGTVSYMFSGTANDVDDSGSGVKEVWVAFTDKNVPISDSTLIKKASGQADWSYTLVFSDNSVFNTEGEKDIHVRAIDTAGNIGEWTKTNFLYDKSKPTSEITSYKNSGDSAFTNFTTSFFTGKSFTLKGKAYDSYEGIASVEVYQKNGDADAVKIAEITDFADFDGTPQEWSVSNLPRDPANPSETYYHSYIDEATGQTVVTNKPETGDYTYYAIAMDKSGITLTDAENNETTIPGKTTVSDEITVKVDTTSPTVTITSPDNTKTGNNALSGSSYIFSVDASDVGVGVDKIHYAFVKAKSNDFGTDSDPENPNPAIPDVPTVWQTTNGSITQSLATGVGTVADNTVCSTGTLDEGHWYLFVKSVDKAGNESSVENIHFHVDMKVPEIKDVTIDSETANENRTFYTSGTSFALAGSVEETYGIKSLTVTESYEGISEADAEPNTVTATDGSWNYTVDLSADTAKDKVVSVTVTATDYAGKTTAKNYTLYRDTVAPEVTAISPANKESLSVNKIKLKGSVVDAGSGTASVSYAITRVGDSSFDEHGDGIVPNGESWKVVTGTPDNLSDEIELGDGEGTFILVVNAVDKVGNTNSGDANDTSVTTRTSEFYVDTENPSITETGINTAAKTVKSYFTLSGLVNDSNALDSTAAVTISVDNGDFETVTFVPATMTQVTAENRLSLKAKENQIGWYYWTKTFRVGSETAGGTAADGTTIPNDATPLTDGVYVFTITAKDVAGKTAVVQRTITVDTRAPKFIPASIDYSGNTMKTEIGEENNKQLWFTDSVVTIKVTVTDQKVSDDPEAEEGSGLSTVKYETQDGKSGYLMKSSENESNDWSTSISFSEGTGNGIRIIAEDAAGNKKVYPEDVPYETIRIDTKVPNISINEPSDLLTNGGEAKQFTIIGTASDVTGGTGIDSVSVKIGANEYTMDEDSTPENWKITFNTPNADESATTNRLASDGIYTIAITAKDKAGLEKTVEKNVTVDTAEAHFVSSSFSSEAAADCGSTGSETWYGSTSLDITGSFTDANSIDSVQWSWDSPEATNADGSPKATWRSFDRSMTGDNSTGYTCTFSGTVPVSTTLKNGTLYVKATDKAGNVTNTTLTGINVDLGYPTLSITSPVGTPLVNGDSDLIVKVKAEDTFLNGATTEVASGIKSVKLKIGSQDFTTPDDSTEIATAGEPDIYTLTISGEMITDLGDSVIQSSVYIQAEDYTGKTQITSFALQIDKNPPTAVITSPYTASILNKEIQFTGRANDDQNLLIVNLYYTTAKVHPGVPNADPDTGNVWIKTAESTLDAEAEAAKTKWVLFETFEGSNGYNWDETIDTTQSRYVNENEDGKSYIHFMAEAFDAARNSGDVSRAISSCTIDQLSDCPVITFSNIKADDHGLLKSTQTIYGTIEDDDGSVNELRVSSKKNANWNDSDSTVCIVRNGSWSYTDTGMTDGDKILYFRVKDAKNSIFVTPDENAPEEDFLRGIYISGTEDNPVQQMKSLKFRIDMNPPQINQQGFRIYQHKIGDPSKAYNDDVALQDNDENKKVRNFENNMILGGTNNLFDFYASAYDANGIKAMSVKIGTQVINGENTGIKDAVGNDVWIMKDVNVSKEMLADDAQNLTITAFDMTDSDSSVILKVRIDNTAPTFTVTSHQNEEERNVTGIVTLRGTASDALSGVKSIKYMIPTIISASEIDENTDTENNKWHDMTLVGTTTWKVEFKNYQDIDGIDPDYSTKELKEYANSTYATETSVDSGVWRVPVYFRMEDEKGNATFTDSFMFFVDPNGDKPKASITYPTTGSTLGGTIRIFGSAEDNDAVGSVFMQIAIVDDDGNSNFNDSDKAFLLSKGYTFDNAPSELSSFVSGKGYLFGTNTPDDDSDDWWGIKVNGKEGWNQTINSNGEFDLEEGKRAISLRVRALDYNGLLGNWSSVVDMEIDKNAPKIGSSKPLKLVQFAADGSVSATQDYQDGVSIKGNWYLTGSAEDDSGIKSITVNPLQGELQVKNGSSWGAFSATYPNPDIPAPTEFRIPINTENSGELSFTITVKENTEQELSTTQSISIKYDNSAPEIGAHLKHNVLSVIGDGTNDTIVIEQSNKTFSIEGTVEDGEGGSGFSRIAIYFKRIGSGTDTATRIYNPAIAKDATGNRTDIVTSGDGVKIVDGLPTLTVTNVSRTLDSLTLTGSVDPNIRVGGLVRIGGVYRLITGVSGNTVTFSPSVDTSYTTAEFVYALIIDNFKIETADYDDNDGSLTKISNDDNDGVIESIEKNSGNLYDWSISIDSKNIPDGPIEICCVAFDKADNISTDFEPVSTSVFNNRPAIANIWIGTDYDNNGEVKFENNESDYGEFAKIRSVVLDPTDILHYEANWKRSASAVPLINVANVFKAIGKTVIRPEIIGGNGTLYYYYAKDSDSATLFSKMATADENDVYAFVTGNTSGDTTLSSITFKTAGSGATKRLAGLGDAGLKNGVHTLYFKIYDSTESCTGNASSISGNNSQWASFSVKFNVNVVDEIPPEATIKPFYWNSKDDNSLYQNNLAIGHIELMSDLQNLSVFDASSELMDTDPKVSGIIKIQGTAKDETCLKSVSIKLDGFTFTGLTPDVDGYVNVSAFNGGSWTQSGTVAADGSLTNGYHFFVTDTKGVTSTGHEITWELDIDTSKIAGVAATNKAFQIKVVDTGDNDNSQKARRDANGNLLKDSNEHYIIDDVEIPSYRMDVVPYIAKVYTTLAALKKNNWSVYNRTTKGHYSVTSDETIYMYGFNLGNSTYKPKYGETVLATPVSGDTAPATNENYSYGASYATYQVVKFPVSNVTASGEVSIMVNNVESLNNKNGNDSKGSYAGVVDLSQNATGDKSKYDNYYNRQPNGENNNLLTDDVVLDVWEIDSTAVKTKTGVATMPVMDINPVNGQIGFAFADNGIYFNMPYGTNPHKTDGSDSQYGKGVEENSYHYWIGGNDFWNSIGFVYDSEGYSYGVVAGGDINGAGDGKADIFRFTTSRWGRGKLNTDGYDDLTNQLGFELIGQQDFYGSGTSYSSYGNFNKERIRSTTLTTAPGNSGTSVYLAYYDAINDEIRFKWGIISNTKGDNGLFVQQYSTGNNRKLSGKTYTLTNNSLIAGQTTNKVIKSDGTKTTTAVMTKDTPSQPVAAGEYVSIVALPGKGTSDDAVVAVWLDSSKNQLVYSYNLTPKSITSGKFAQADTKWSTPVPILQSGVGEYCKVVADGNDGIHIAAYDGLGGDLWYAYVSDFKHPENAKEGMVDSSGFVGNELNIDVALESGKPVPYISYYALSASRPKIARWNGSDLKTVAESVVGAEDEVFTQNWEVSYIPTTSKVSIDHVNVGVWKNSSGELTYSTTDGAAPNGIAAGATGSNLGNNDSTHVVTGHTNESYGKVYGNGTKNAVLGYAITSGNNGYIETAQMK